MIMESQVSGLANFGLGKLVIFPNLDKESHAMRVTCIIIRIILYTTHIVLHIAHNILHIAYDIFHIICSYAMKLWKHGPDSKTSQNKGSIYGTSIREPSSANRASALFIHMYFILFHS